MITAIYCYSDHCEYETETTAKKQMPHVLCPELRRSERGCVDTCRVTFKEKFHDMTEDDTNHNHGVIILDMP